MLRWLAASAVVLYHFQDHHFGSETLTRFFPSNGNGYVMVFFVISGFVIAMTAERKTLLQFGIDRAIRIYIVAIPVLAITAALAFFFPNVSDAFPDAIQRPLTNSLWNAAFLCQSWSAHCVPYLNEPYWSLNYEVAYYLIFAAAFYTSPPVKWLLVSVLCAIAGPKILILMPCWLAGVAAYRLRDINVPRALTPVAAFAVPAILTLALAIGLKDFAHRLSMMATYFLYTPSEGFIRAWIVALSVAVHLWGMSRLSISMPVIIQKTARQLAGMSYSLYLFHLPLLYMTYHFLEDRSSVTSIFIALGAIYSLCYLLSLLTEAKTGRVIEAIRSVRQYSANYRPQWR